MKKLILLIFIIGFCGYTKADSPLTSTYFADNYLDNRTIASAQKNEGELTENQCQFLSSNNNAIELKIALINAKGWNIDGQNNFGIYQQFLLEKYKLKSNDDYLFYSADELLCLGYMLAMDNYFEVDLPLEILEKAVSANPKSYTFNLIYALVEAQRELDTNWCNVWKVCDKVETNKSLIMDMKAKSISDIFEYINEYKASCK